MTRSRLEVEYQEHEISDLVVYQMGSISIRPLLTVAAVVLYLTTKRHYFSSALFFICFTKALFYCSQVRSCSVQNISIQLTILRCAIPVVFLNYMVR